MHKYILIIASLLVFSNITAQNTINGSVKNQKTGAPLMGVSVLIENTNIGTTTDFDGNFKLTYTSNKEVTISASYTGFATEKAQLNMSDIEKPIVMLLHEKVMELDEVILSTPFNKLQSENVVRVATKSIESMQKKGIQNLMDGIVQITGVNQQSTGSGISKPVIRGLTGSRVLVYNQGVRLENFQFGEEHGLGIDEAGISSVEVIKGPASLLYGSDAMGGVLYLVPEKYAIAKETKVDLFSKFTSNTSGFNTNLGYKVSGDHFHLLSRVALNTHSDYRIPNQKAVINSRYNDYDAKIGVGYKNNTFDTDIRYNYNQAQNGLANSIGLHQNRFKITGVHQKLDNHYLSDKSTFYLPNSKITTNLGFTSHKRQLIVLETTKIGMQLKTFNYDAKWYLPKNNKLESILGVQGMFQSNTNFGKHYLLPNAAIQGIGLFSTLNYTFGNLVVQGGVRYDVRKIKTKDIGLTTEDGFRPSFTKKLHNFTGSLGLKVNPIEKTTFRFNFATGFRSPNLAEFTSSGIHENKFEKGNPALENEQNFQADIALEYKSTHLEFFSNAFYNRINNYIYLAPTGTEVESYPIYQYQQDDAKLYGGEVGFHLHPHPLDWLHLDSSFETVIGVQNNGEFLPLIPANTWKNTIRYSNTLNKGFIDNYYINLALDHTFKAIKVSEYENIQKAYSLANISVGSKISNDKFHLNLTLSVHNLFDKEYISHLSVLREDEIPNMGRNIILGFHIKY